MTTKQPKTASKKPGRSLTPEGRIRRKRKTQDIKREIRQEWNDTESDYRAGKSRNAGCFWWLSQITAAAGEDYRNNVHLYGNRKKTLEFYWKPGQAEPIKVKYFISKFGACVPLPPESCHYTRLAMGLPTKKRITITDEWERKLIDYFTSQKASEICTLTTNDLLIRVLDIEEVLIAPKHQAAIGRIMKKLGWKRRRQSTPPRLYGYVRP